MNVYLKELRKSGDFLVHIEDYAQEAVLQHYGLKTRWLDVVDNIWIGLWFACYKAVATGRHDEFLHFERRVKGRDGAYAYLYMIESAAKPVEDNPGYYEDATSSTIDLRLACPSHFIRPHAQHGLLVRAHPHPSAPDLDYSTLIAGIIRVDLDLALGWLGNADTLSAHALFPPPVYDYGYRELLDGFRPSLADKTLGQIQHIGA